MCLSEPFTSPLGMDQLLRHAAAAAVYLGKSVYFSSLIALTDG